MAKPAVLVARAIFPEVLARLAPHFDVDANLDDRIYEPDELLPFGTQAPAVHVEPVAQLPQVPPQPSGPHVLPEHEGVQPWPTNVSIHAAHSSVRE